MPVVFRGASKRSRLHFLPFSFTFHCAPTAHKESLMPTSTPAPSNPGAAIPYVVRVLTADATKKGAAAAVAGILVAAISEAIWPST